MSKRSQQDLAIKLETSDSPREQLALAMELLAMTQSRQHLDLVLLKLSRESVMELLDDEHRPVIRQKAEYYFEHNEKDKAGLLREKLIRLLVQIRHPEDLDLYLKGVNTYYPQPVDDVAQNLRAVSLVGLAGTDEQIAIVYATKLIGETDTSVFNCEPSVTAISVLEQQNRILPIYHFAYAQGDSFIAARKGEAVSRAMESLGSDFPAELYAQLAAHYIEMDASVVCTGVLNYIINHRRSELYPLIENILHTTKDADLYRFTLITMAISRDDDLVEMLYRLARLAPKDRLPDFIEAVEYSIHSERDAMLEMLQRRV